MVWFNVGGGTTVTYRFTLHARHAWATPTSPGMRYVFVRAGGTASGPKRKSGFRRPRPGSTIGCRRT